MAKKKKFNIADNKLLVIFVVIILAVVAWNVYQQIPRSSAFGLIAPGGSIGDISPDDGITPIKTDLTANLDASSPEAKIVLGGNIYSDVAKYQFNAVGSGYTIQKLAITIPNNGYASVSKLKLEYPNKLGQVISKEMSVSAEKSKFSGLTMYVPKDASATINVKATFKKIGQGGEFGAHIKFGLKSGVTIGDFYAVSDNGFTVDTKISSQDIYGAEHILYNSEPVVTSANPGVPSPIIPGGVVDLYRFKVSADASGDVALKRLTFSITITDASTTTTSSADLSNFTFSINGVDATSSSQITAVSNNGFSYIPTPMYLENDSYPLENGSTYWVQVAFGNYPAADQEQPIPAGQSKTYILEAQAGTGFATGDSIAVRLLGDSIVNPDNKFAYLTDLDFDLGVQQIISLQNSAGAQLGQPIHFIWSDRSSIAHISSFDDDGIIETSSADWTQGYLVKNFPLSPHMLTL